MCAKESILIVDDTPKNLQLLSQMLHEEGYIVRAVLGGAQALRVVQANPPDLILLDIMMPLMNGYEVCTHLKASEETRSIPIIFISALDAIADKIKAFQVGGADYVTKPFQVTEVLARIQTHLDIRKLQRELEAANQALNERIEELDHANAELERRNEALQTALRTIKTLSGLVPICAWCGRKIQDEAGQWVNVELYVMEHSEAQFTHGICPDCLETFLDDQKP